MTSLVQKIEQIPLEYTQEKIDLLKSTVCKGATNSEFQLFLHVCQRTGLDPFMRQIYSIPRGGQRTIQTSIDGLRLIAERSGRYSPGKESFYNYDDKGCLISSTAYIKKMTPDGTWHEVSATAMFSEYNPGNNTFWKKMPHVMLAKCAEALALRKAFPAEMSGVYTSEEMNQAEPIVMETVAHQAIDKKEIPDARAIDDKFHAFFAQFPEEEHRKIEEYLQKYSKHWKKEFWEALDDYQDKEKLLNDYEKWLKKNP